MTCLVVRRKGVDYEVLVDDDDLESLKQYNWFIDNHGYAWRNGRTVNGKRESNVKMHRQIMGSTPGDGRDVDHINGNKLDNRRSNLRRVTRSENMQNSTGHRDRRTSTERGVSAHRASGKWIAQHMYAGKSWWQICNTEAEAIAAVRARRLEVLGYESTPGPRAA